MGRGGRSRGGSWGGSSARTGKLKGGFFGSSKPRPLEQDISNMFALRGIKNIGRVEIIPEPDENVDYLRCKSLINFYVKGMKRCNEWGRPCPENFHEYCQERIEERCGFRIDNSDAYFEK